MSYLTQCIVQLSSKQTFFLKCIAYRLGKSTDGTRPIQAGMN
jgi:hypothetical protein